MATFYETVTEAINDIIENGYDSEERIQDWLERIRRAADETLTSEATLNEAIRDMLTTIYTRMVDRGGIFQQHPGVAKFTIDKVKPHLRAELDRRIVASAGLIKLNREAMIQRTLQRFAGWSTSIPAGGTDAASRRETKASIGKALKSLPFEERRVMIDQGHKFTSALNEIVATDGGAIAARWRSNWRQVNYDYRKDHKERDGKVYLIRDSWAHRAGLVKPGKPGYVDEITRPGEEVYCRCYYVYLYALRDLPEDMLTRKGEDELERVRARIRNKAA